MIQVVEKKELLKKLNYFSDLPSMKILLVFSHVSQEIEQMEVEMKVSMTEYLSSSVDVILNSIKTIRKKLIQTFKEIKRETLSLKQQEVVETDSVRLINYYKNLMVSLILRILI